MIISTNPLIPQLCISIQPKQRGYRFRYPTENLEHGHLLGDREGMRVPPTITIQNCLPSANIYILVSLCVEHSDQVHEHNLHGNNVFNGQYLVELQADVNGCLTCPIDGISICRTKKSSKQNMLCCKLAQNEILKKNGIKSYIDSMKQSVGPKSVFNESWFEKNIPDLNSVLGEVEYIHAVNNTVRLHCQAFVFDNENQYIHLHDISQTVFNNKSAAKSILRIEHISHVSGSTMGDETVTLLCDIVERDDIEIVFYTLDGKCIGMGSHVDVWHQHAIRFRTPPYPLAVEAKLCLHRKSNPNDISNFFCFRFIPPFTYPIYTAQDLIDPGLHNQPQLPYYPPYYQQPPQNPDS